MLINDNVMLLPAEAKNDVLEIIRQEINPGYTVVLWCGHCVCDMLKYAFKEMDK